LDGDGIGHAARELIWERKGAIARHRQMSITVLQREPGALQARNGSANCVRRSRWRRSGAVPWGISRVVSASTSGADCEYEGCAERISRSHLELFP
jgi:hypothetical protein